MALPAVAAAAAKAAAAAVKTAAKKGAKKGAVKAAESETGQKVIVGGITAIGAIGLLAGLVVLSMVVGVMGVILTAIGSSVTSAGKAYMDTCFGGVTTVGSPYAGRDIPPVALRAYQQAGSTAGLDWTYIAAIGKVESGHGSYGGARLSASGVASPHIIGIPLNGTNGTAAIRDTDGGRMDGDRQWDRAVGPMQFIPSTWSGSGKDGNSDGKKDPHNIFDAALATAFYLKAGGAPGNMRRAIFSYNHSTAYVNQVMGYAQRYQGNSGTQNVSARTGVNTGPVVAMVQPRLGPFLPPRARQNLAPGWMLPMKPGAFTYTARWHQAGSAWSSGYHTGLDFAAPVGRPVYAAADGVIQHRPDQASWAGPNFLIIHHGNVNGKNVDTWYAHMSSAVRKSGPVQAGELIGYVGSEGNSSGPHLHFEVRVNGRDVDPLIWLAGAGAPTGMDITTDGCGPTGTSGLVGGNGAWGGYQNGKIPLSAMCKLSFSPTYLECHAAAAAERLNAAFKQRFRTPLNPVGGYRSYADQVLCREQKGSLCAVPGTSNHGWGLALDLSCCAINSFSSPQHRWLRVNAPKFGWDLPKWARQGGSKPEPWHWEFVASGLGGTSGTGNSGYSTGAPPGNTAAPGRGFGVDNFRIMSFNVLGWSHTDGKRANKPYMANASVRLDRAIKVIERNHASIVGFQEFEKPQARWFKQRARGWNVFSMDRPSNGIGWDTSRWSFVSGGLFNIPYFHGKPKPQTVVRLKSRTTGVEIAVVNVHNPANVAGPAQHHRDKATAIEGELTRALDAAGMPVFLTGDMNDTGRFFCQITSYGVVHAANGGSNTDRCRPPRNMRIDWVLGNSMVDFGAYWVDHGAKGWASDHPAIVARAVTRR